MKKTRIGIFGIGHNHAAAAIDTLRKTEGAEIAGLYEPSDETYARRVKENPGVYDDIPRFSLDELCATGVEAAMVESSVPDLVDTATICAERGLHVHMDKPAGTNLNAYKKFLDIAKDKKLVFQTGYMYRYNAGIRYVLNKAKRGELGRIYNIVATMSTKHPEWFKRQLSGYGVKCPSTFIFGGHLIDLVMKLKGNPKELTAFNAVSGDGGIELTDTSVIVMSYPDGIATVKTSSVEVNGWGMREFTVYGEKGTVSVSPIECPMIVREAAAGEGNPWKDCHRVIDIPEEGRYDVMMREFIDMIQGTIPYDVDFEHEYNLQKYTLEACGYDVD